MRLGYRQSQVVLFDSDEQSTASTSFVETRKQEQQQEGSQVPLPSEASSSSSCTIISSTSSSLSDDLNCMWLEDTNDIGDDSSSSSSLPSQQQQQQQQQLQYSQSLLAADCDIDGDPPYENIINQHGSSKSVHKQHSNVNNTGSLIHCRLPQQKQQSQHRHCNSSSSRTSSEDEDDEEGSEDPSSWKSHDAQQHQTPQHESRMGEPKERYLEDSIAHEEQPIAPQHIGQDHRQSETEHRANKRGNEMGRATEPMDSNEYDGDGQHQPRAGSRSSKDSDKSRRGAGDDDDDTIPDRDQDGDETDIEDDGDDDDGSDHEVPIWKPQDTQSVCEFTHTIKDYSAKRDSGCKKAEYSATTVDNMGNKWRLIVYVNGNGRASNNHLSLFLQVADADDLPFGWKKAVSYVLTLEHPHAGAGLSYAKRNPDKTFKLCPKAIDWGWSQFITSDRIQQESFVSNDSLVVRASVTVKSSSVDIDIDDAELYLKCAVEEGRPDAVQLCLDQGASVNCQFKDDLYTPLHTACSTSPNEDGVNSALGGEHNKPNNSQSKNNNNENNALATHEGSMKVLELLLEKGADGNACNKWRETPLLIAANNGHKAAVEALLKHGADPSLCSEAGWSALTFAAHKGYGDIVELLLDDGAPVNCRVTEDASTPLHKACAGSKPGHLEAVKLLLESHADVHALNKWRETPLLTAANHGQAGAVELLLRAGADPCKCTDTGWSPLSIAAYKGHDEVVKLLLEEGAPTEEADPTLSALLQAATKGLPDTVELLLRHGADHTVTTKKGDTALSILVEQNLIDAAVEMVTEYKASIPRCSRDRKKVQRARLLINLRLKQQQRENGSDDDDDEIPESISELGGASSNNKSKAKKKKKKKTSAEQQAKAAEEALLLELEQEDAERHKLEQDASKKSAKKRKKKERERQLKKEQEEKRQAEERKEQERRKKLQEEKEAAEREERQRIAAAQRKEEEEARRKQEKAMRQQQQKERELRKKQRKEEEERKKLLQQQQREKAKGGNNSSKNGIGSVTSKSTGRATNLVAPKNGASSNASASNGGNKRGWETLPVKHPEPEKLKTTVPVPPVHPPAVHKQSYALPRSVNDTVSEDRNAAENRAQPTSKFAINSIPVNSMDSNLDNAGRYNSGMPSTSFSGMVHVTPMQVEPPAVSIFRQEKVSELLHRFSAAKAPSDPMGAVDLVVVKKVLFRWIVRAAHESSGYLDFIVPSWDDLDKLTTFFQRQFISETRKYVRTPMSMESLKDAGTATAHLCYSLAKDVSDFHRRVLDQIRQDWSDASIGMTVSEIHSNIGGSTVVINWANQSRVTISGAMFIKLKERFKGPKAKFLSSIFMCKTCYGTKNLLVEDTLMDYSLTPIARSSLSSELSVNAEIWADPFLVDGGNTFFGQFAEIDGLFGGLKPFGTTEDFLSHRGGSVVVLAPPDSMLASRYLSRIIDIIDACEHANLPVSFAIFLRSECLVNQKSPPSTDDIYMLEPRLRDRSNCISRAETLVGGAHFYFSEKMCGPQPSATTSIFVLLQNSLGKNRFPIRNVGILQILGSMEGDIKPISDPAIGNTLSYVPKMTAPKEPNFISDTRFLQPTPNLAVSPTPPQPALSSDFGFNPIGPTPSLPTTFTQEASSGVPRRAGPRRGRLFDLVDNGEEDTLNDVDVVSGMLGSLNVDLFQSSGTQDVDIEAISLMGIGDSSTAFHPRSNRTRGRFG